MAKHSTLKSSSRGREETIARKQIRRMKYAHVALPEVLVA